MAGGVVVQEASYVEFPTMRCKALYRSPFLTSSAVFFSSRVFKRIVFECDIDSVGSLQNIGDAKKAAMLALAVATSL